MEPKKPFKARVLLVDDEKDFIQTLTKRLEVRGLTVSSATRGEDALNLTRQKNFDIVVLDLSMPGMDGLETLKKIKAKDPEVEIVMLSGHGTVKSSAEAIKLGAEDFLEKPVDIQDLLDKIGEAKDKRILVLKKRAQQQIEDILQNKAW